MRFDGWTVSLSTGELDRDGQRRRLASQPLAVLAALLERPGELVTREELIARLWPRGVVEFDTALNSAVRRLRIALDDHAETPRYIETIPKRGYRFIGRLDATPDSTSAPVPAPVPVAVPTATSIPPASPDRTAPRPAPRWPWAVAAGIAIVAAGTLPFVMGTSAAPGTRVAASATVDPGDQETYTVARYLLQRRGPGDLATAKRYFERVTRSDPSNARAWAGLAGACWLSTVEKLVPATDGLACVRDAATEAARIDPRLAEAHLRLTNYYGAIGQRQLAEASYRRAIDVAPDDPLVLNFQSSDAADAGRYDEAAELARRAVEADPLSTATRWNRAAYLFYAGRAVEVRETLDELRELRGSLDDDDGLYARSLVIDGQYAEALQVAGAERQYSWRWQVEAMALSAMGRHDDSDAALRRLLESGRANDLLRAAEVHVFRGEYDRAFEAMARATSTCLGGECEEMTWQLKSPLFGPLHADARWPTALDEVDRAQGRQRLARNVPAGPAAVAGR